MSTVSFTYGDSMQHADQGPFNDKPYKNQVYTYDEILEIVKEYGWIIKTDNWHWGIPCYIEAQLWSDIPIEKYRYISLYDYINLRVTGVFLICCRVQYKHW